VKVEEFRAVADIVGRRVKVSWNVVLEEGEGLGAAPVLTLRRKERDFEFPDPGGGPDPFLVYSSAAFPPAGASVTEVDLGEASEDGLRTVSTALSASRVIAGTPVEVLRRTRTIAFDAARNPLRYREEILDVHDRPEGLEPGTTYYYELGGPALSAADPAAFLAVATATEVHRSGRMLYELLPAILRRHDVTNGPARATGAIPEASPDNGHLRRFIDLFGAGVDHLRSRADGLRDLHDVDTVDHRLLPHLASWLGWNLSHGKPISIQRHEIKYAAALYRITGTLPGCMIWVKRLTGWDARVKEFWRNVFFTNDLGNPGDPTDRGSRTIDTSNQALLSSMGTFDDAADYVPDTGTGPDDWYSTNRVGIFASPEPGESADDVLRKRGRVLSDTGLFLPFNMQAVVVLETETVSETADVNLGLTRTKDEGGG
jgi:phage tail-like protein